MSRVSQEELYNDKDVVTQILKLKDTVNDYAGGIIENIDISGNNLVIDWEDGTSISLPLPDPVTGISSVTGNVSGGNLTITFYFSNGTTHSFTCPLSGMASEAYVDAKDAQNVKLTGAQTVAGVKTFSDSPVVPTTPTSPTGAVNDVYVNDATDGVNNILHKSGYERITSAKDFASYIDRTMLGLATKNTVPAAVQTSDMIFRAVDGDALCIFRFQVNELGYRTLFVGIWNPNLNDYSWTPLAEVTP
jgi:hypothetical protein